LTQVCDGGSSIGIGATQSVVVDVGVDPLDPYHQPIDLAPLDSKGKAIVAVDHWALQLITPSEAEPWTRCARATALDVASMGT